MPFHNDRYKAYFRWNHYCHKLKNDTPGVLPTETDACPSVTAAFLQVCCVGLVVAVVVVLGMA